MENPRWRFAADNFSLGDCGWESDFGPQLDTKIDFFAKNDSKSDKSLGGEERQRSGGPAESGSTGGRMVCGEGNNGRRPEECFAVGDGVGIAV